MFCSLNSNCLCSSDHMVDAMAEEHAYRSSDLSWVIEMKNQALLEYNCLEYIFSNCDGMSLQRLHDACGYNTLHSLKLKSFIQVFCEKFLTAGVGFMGVDGQGVPKRVWSCRNPSACVIHTIEECNRTGWLLKTSLYGS